MLHFRVPDMACGHCASALSKAVRGVDEKAEIQIDLGKQEIIVRTTASAHQLVDALKEAGYRSQALAA